MQKRKMTDNETKVRCLRLSIMKSKQTKKLKHIGANSEISSPVENKEDLKVARSLSNSTYIVDCETKDVDISLLNEESRITSAEYKEG